MLKKSPDCAEPISVCLKGPPNLQGIGYLNISFKCFCHLISVEGKKEKSPIIQWISRNHKGGNYWWLLSNTKTLKLEVTAPQ